MKSKLHDGAENSMVFDWCGIQVLQREDVFKIGTDALLLGGWLPSVVHQASTVLDVGTGTGILALMIARSFPDAYVYGIDPNMNAVDLARHNVISQGWENRVSIEKGDVTVHPEETESMHDLVLSNPPFFSSGLRSADTARAIARHRSHDVKDWVDGFVCRIRPGGHAGLVLPYDETPEWIRHFNERGFFVHDRMDIYPGPSADQPIRVLLHFREGLEGMKMTDLHLRQSDGNYTEAFLRLTRIRQHGK